MDVQSGTQTQVRYENTSRLSTVLIFMPTKSIKVVVMMEAATTELQDMDLGEDLVLELEIIVPKVKRCLAPKRLVFQVQALNQR